MRRPGVNAGGLESNRVAYNPLIFQIHNGVIVDHSIPNSEILPENKQQFRSVSPGIGRGGWCGDGLSAAGG